MDFLNKNILITGGSRGIGLAICNIFKDLGGNVISLNSKDCDFSKDDVNKFIKDINNIDILINNAGINKIDSFSKINDNDFDRIIKVNVKTPFIISKHVIKNMKKNNWGRIINIASIWGSKSKKQRTSYTTSKSALIGMTKTMAIEYAQHNILINSVSPGFTDTELTSTILSKKQKEELINQVPIKRMAKPEEIANTVAFLCSNLNTYITGQDIIIDGGFTIT
tara:strand:- start:3662 stop:4330 length:669 start_codon:yes stop_codon:yes gene_type:complete